ncbi:MAG: patatin family protein [Erysipelotrichaceae bacterium]
MNKNIGLVLEGGGFRGSYTAGALNWLADQGIFLNYAVTISASTPFAFLYLTNNIQQMHDISVNGLSDKNVFGINPIFKEGSIVGYNFLIDKYMRPYYKEALKVLRESDKTMEVGLYNMTQQQLQYFNKDEFDDDVQMFKASCTLPLAGRMTEINGNKYLDGGIRTMVSIERSMATGHEKNLVIVTKDKNYVRKPNGFLTSTLLKLVYGKYKTMLASVDNRVDAYYSEMNMVYQLEEQQKALLIRPSKDTGVKRFSGSVEQLEQMYQLGYQDMEDRKEEIYKFLEMED